MRARKHEEGSSKPVTGPVDTTQWQAALTPLLGLYRPAPWLGGRYKNSRYSMALLAAHHSYITIESCSSTTHSGDWLSNRKLIFAGVPIVERSFDQRCRERCASVLSPVILPGQIFAPSPLFETCSSLRSWVFLSHTVASSRILLDQRRWKRVAEPHQLRVEGWGKLRQSAGECCVLLRCRACRSAS